MQSASFKTIHSLYKQIRTEGFKPWRNLKDLELIKSGIYWSFFAHRVLSENGFNPIYQAGACFWPCDRDNHSRGFGYDYFGSGSFQHVENVLNDPKLKLVINDLHVWVALLDTREIVDFACGYFPEIMSIQSHGQWTAKKPPAFLCMPSGNDTDCLYDPDFDASGSVSHFLKKDGGDHFLKRILTR